MSLGRTTTSFLILIVGSPRAQSSDADLRENRRGEMLNAMAARYTPKKQAKPSLDLIVKPFGTRRAPDAAPLFANDEEISTPTVHDEALALTLQEEEMGSDEDAADTDLARALAQSRKETEHIQRSTSSSPLARLGEGSDDSLEEVSLVPSSRSTPQPLLDELSYQQPFEADDEDEFEEIAAPLASTNGTVRSASRVTSTKGFKAVHQEKAENSPRQHASPSLVNQMSSSPTVLFPSSPPAVSPRQVQSSSAYQVDVDDEDGSSSEEVARSTIPADDVDLLRSSASAARKPRMQRVIPSLAAASTPLVQKTASRQATVGVTNIFSEVGENLESVSQSPLESTTSSAMRTQKVLTGNEELDLPGAAPLWSSEFRQPLPPLNRSAVPPQVQSVDANGTNRAKGIPGSTTIDQSGFEAKDIELVPQQDQLDEDEEDSRSIEWSRSASPAALSRPALQTERSGEIIPSEVEDEDVDMNREDMVAEEDDYARFMAQIKNRDLNEVRTEIDDEIRVLHSQNKVAMRDSDEITQAMVGQIQVSGHA